MEKKRITERKYTLETKLSAVLRTVESLTLEKFFRNSYLEKKRTPFLKRIIFRDKCELLQNVY